LVFGRTLCDGCRGHGVLLLLEGERMVRLGQSRTGDRISAHLRFLRLARHRKQGASNAAVRTVVIRPHSSSVRVVNLGRAGSLLHNCLS
jgi:hypothetical protein